MSHTLAPADVSHYYQRLAELSTLPFWQREEFTEPAGPERGHVWHWQDVYPELARSRQFAADAAGLQRRALILCNPGLTAPAAGATPTIAAACQMLFPGERAPVHAHSISAMRFGLAGSGARMIIDGDRVPMEPGDLILTPPAGAGTATSIPAATSPRCGWTASTPPFVLGLRAGFIRDDPYPGDPLPVRDTTGTAAETAETAALLPAGTRNGQHSPVRRYPWDEAYPALRRLMARSPGRNTLTSLEYRSPLTGGPALATLAACSRACPPAPGPGRAGKPQARSSWWPAAPGR